MRDLWDIILFCLVFGLVFLLMLWAIVGFAAYVNKDRNIINTSVEDQGAWLKIERSASVSGHRIVVGCDVLTGDRLYIVQSGYGDGVTVVPGGCK